MFTWQRPPRPLGSPGFMERLDKLMNRVLEPRKPGPKPRSDRRANATAGLMQRSIWCPPTCRGTLHTRGRQSIAQGVSLGRQVNGTDRSPNRGDRNSPACAGFCRPAGASPWSWAIATRGSRPWLLTAAPSALNASSECHSGRSPVPRPETESEQEAILMQDTVKCVWRPQIARSA